MEATADTVGPTNEEGSEAGGDEDGGRTRSRVVRDQAAAKAVATREGDPPRQVDATIGGTTSGDRGGRSGGGDRGV